MVNSSQCIILLFVNYKKIILTKSRTTLNLAATNNHRAMIRFILGVFVLHHKSGKLKV